MSSFDDRWALWRGLLAEQEVSGLSAAAWRRERGISVSTFSYWRRRLRQEGAGPSGWMLVGGESVVPLGIGAEAITLRVGPVSVEVPAGFDPQLLGDVLGVLVARC